MKRLATRLARLVLRAQGPGPDPIPNAYPPGHFHSPLVAPAEIAPREAAIWQPRTALPGIDFNDASHEALLDGAFARELPSYDYPDELPARAPPTLFHSRNDQFGWLDARALFALLREWRPPRVVEVGSGFSTLLIADQKRRGPLGGSTIEAIEPYPRAFLGDPALGIALHETKVQAMPLAFFESLRAGDVLFVDSSHVAKTGSDVVFLYLEVFPRLQPGVIVHVHDIFLPLEYPREWVLAGRHWNEQYLLQALLAHSPRYRILFGSTYARLRFGPRVAALMGAEVARFGGGSLWFSVR